MRIVDCEQRSPEWYAARRGIPTASEFGNIIQPVKGGYAAAASSYMNCLIDQIVRPEADGWSGDSDRHIVRGRNLEEEALEVYAFERDVTLRRVGFVLNDEGTLGCSPDAMVCNPHASPDPEGYAAGLPYIGGVETKCPDGKTHLAYLRAAGLPSEYRAQVHGSLIVTGAPWWDFVSYCPPYPLLIVRVVPDAFTDALRGCLERFLREYHAARDSILEQIA